MVERGLAKYAVGQLERGSESGRLHLQYFVQMERSRLTNPYEIGYL